MSKTHTFATGDGETVALNSLQLYGLLNIPSQNASWPTYWALRRRNLITVGSPTTRTARGQFIVDNFGKKPHGSET